MELFQAFKRRRRAKNICRLIEMISRNAEQSTPEQKVELKLQLGNVIEKYSVYQDPSLSSALCCLRQIYITI